MEGHPGSRYIRVRGQGLGFIHILWAAFDRVSVCNSCRIQSLSGLGGLAGA